MVVEISDPIVVEHFRVIAEAYSVVNSITAGRVLARLLEIKDGADVVSMQVMRRGSWTYSLN